jgi:hypothetical protein
MWSFMIREDSNKRIQMKKVLAVATLALATAGVAVGGVYEGRVSPDMKTQLRLLFATTEQQQKKQQNEQQQRIEEDNARQALSNARLEVENARLDVRFAELKGGSGAKERSMLSLAESNLNAMETAIGEMDFTDRINAELGDSRYPSPDVVYAELPSHVSTIRDRVVLGYLREAMRLRTEESLCYNNSKSPESECAVFEKKATRGIQLVEKAAK